MKRLIKDIEMGLVFIALLPILAGISLLYNTFAYATMTTRVSVDSDGNEANNSSGGPAISAHGRFVVFDSHASNLVPGDYNDRKDIFVHDRSTGETTRVSVANDGIEANQQSFKSSITADGRYVAFLSNATNLVPEDDLYFTDVFVHDRLTETTWWVQASKSAPGPIGAAFDRPAISVDDDLRVLVAFESNANDLVPGDTNLLSDIFVRYVFVNGIYTTLTTRVSVASDGTPANRLSRKPVMSENGRFVAFQSLATNLVPGDNNNGVDVFVHDLILRTTERVSVANDGTEASGKGPLAISPSGRFVAFVSGHPNLVLEDTNDSDDIFVRDRVLGTTRRACFKRDGTQTWWGCGNPSICMNGQSVAFSGSPPDIWGVARNRGESWVFVYNLFTGEVTLVSKASDGTYPNPGGGTGQHALSSDCRLVTFMSFANNLVPLDTGKGTDIFVHGPIQPEEEEDTTPPACEIIEILPGPPTTVSIDIEDFDSGVEQIDIDIAHNALVEIPEGSGDLFAAGNSVNFDPPETTAFTVLGIKQVHTKSMQVQLSVTDAAGNLTTCDPVIYH